MQEMEEENLEMEALKNQLKRCEDELKIEEQKNMQNASKIELLNLEIKHLKENLEQTQVRLFLS